MDIFKNAAFSLAAASLTAGMILLLMPKGSMENTVRTVTVALLLTVTVSPFLNGKSLAFSEAFDIAYTEEVQVADDISYLMRRELTHAAEQEIVARVEETLRATGADYDTVTVTAGITKTGGVTLSRIYIKVNTKNEKSEEKMREAVMNVFGLEPVIEVKK